LVDETCGRIISIHLLTESLFKTARDALHFAVGGEQRWG
jgi:hypothetical protein